MNIVVKAYQKLILGANIHNTRVLVWYNAVSQLQVSARLDCAVFGVVVLCYQTPSHLLV